jgi:small-conductance mechanosensitive channel
MKKEINLIKNFFINHKYVLVAIVIMTIGLVVANFVSELVEKSVAMSDFITTTSIRTLKTVAKWIIIVFAILAALSQLGVAPKLIQVFFTGVVMMFALAGGIAFGLGGKDKAREIIEKTFNK